MKIPLDLQLLSLARARPRLGWISIFIKRYETLPPEEYDFSECAFRINNKAYYEYSEEFANVVNRRIIWNAINK